MSSCSCSGGVGSNSDSGSSSNSRQLERLLQPVQEPLRVLVIIIKVTCFKVRCTVL